MTLDSSKWYFRTYAYILAFLCVGPFALPMVWVNPRYSTAKKIFITAVTLIISCFIFTLLVKSTMSIYNYYNQILQLTK